MVHLILQGANLLEMKQWIDRCYTKLKQKFSQFVELYVKYYEYVLQIEGVCNEEDDQQYVKFYVS